MENDEYTPFQEWAYQNRSWMPRNSGEVLRSIVESLPDRLRTRGEIACRLRALYQSGEFTSKPPELGRVVITDEIVRKR